LISVTGRHKGFSLIEIVVVTAVIALALTLVGPRIGAGIGRLELEQAAQSVRSFVKLGRAQAQRADRQHFVVIDTRQDSIVLLDPDMRPIRRADLPSSVHFVHSDSDLLSFVIAPSGIVRGGPVRLRGRTGDLEVSLQ
jgi:prepilin-type N-terminal cleavage/methylation domain-containing protein